MLLRNPYEKIIGTEHTIRNGLDLAEAEDIKERWQQYTEELYKKGLHDQDNHYDVIAHLEPDILECEVKWALESITMNKASGGDGIPVELFQILEDDAVKVLHSICQQIWSQHLTQHYLALSMLKKEIFSLPDASLSHCIHPFP